MEARLGVGGLQLGHAPFRNYDTWLWETYEIQRDIQVTTLSFASVPHFLIGNHRIATLPAHDLTGAGVDIPDSYDPDGFRARHGLERSSWRVPE